MPSPPAANGRYLGVFNENDVAKRAYLDVGFAQVGDACPDLLLIG